MDAIYPSTDALQALAVEPPQIDVADDPARGLGWVLDTFGPRTIALFDPLKRRPSQFVYLDETTRSTAIALVRTHNIARVGMNAYWHVNPTPPGFKSKASKLGTTAIEVVGQADIDAKGGRTMEDCWATIRALPLAPSFIIMTGGGFQIGYQLTEALPPAEIDWAESVSRRVRQLTKGDAVDDICRVFRLPFTINWPDAKKQDDGRVPTPSGLVVAGGVW